MGKKSRRKHEAAAGEGAASSPGMWDSRRAQFMLAGVVIVLSVGLGILIVTLLGGASLSEPEAAKLPAPTPQGEQPRPGQSTVAGLLADKGWADMTDDERTASLSEFIRAFHNVDFRTQNSLVLAVDVWRREGHTIASRVYFESGDPGVDGNTFLYARSSFYCDLPGGGFRVHRFLKSPTETTYELADPGTLPRTFDDAVLAADWSGPVTDLGLTEIEGRTARGYELGFRGGDDETANARYWFDVETAQLLKRAEVVPEESDTDDLAFTINYVILPPLDISGAPETPACVQDIIDRLEG